MEECYYLEGVDRTLNLYTSSSDIISKKFIIKDIYDTKREN